MIAVMDLMERNELNNPHMCLNVMVGFDEGEMVYQMEASPTTLPAMHTFFDRDWGMKRRYHRVGALLRSQEAADRITQLGMRNVYNLWRFPVNYGFGDTFRMFRHHKGSFTVHTFSNDMDRPDWGSTPLEKEYNEMCEELVADCALREPYEFDREGRDAVFAMLGTDVIVLKDTEGVGQAYASYSVEPASHLYVWTAYVRPAYRSTRLFGVLVSLLLQAARERGCAWVAGSTDGTAVNPLPAMFAKRGGQVISETWMEI